jgi:nitrate/nitrite transport system ATP-binding protein
MTMSTTTPTSPILKYQNVEMSFGRSRILSQVDLSINAGEFFAIVGPSGCGKTTLVNLAAGLLRPTRGEVLYKGKPVAGPGPERAVVFQNYSLLPWLTVQGNIALAVDQIFSKQSKGERAERVERVIQMVKLTHARDRRPGQLSGGMRQRVSLARTLAMEPEILLLDEPLAALDALTRSKLQEEITSLVRSGGKTVLLITNDVDEALLMADYVLTLRPGMDGATLSEPLQIPIPHPRERTALNNNPLFCELRKQVLSSLIAATTAHREAASVRKLVLPAIQPEDITHLSLFERWFPGRGPRRPAEVHLEPVSPSR